MESARVLFVNTFAEPVGGAETYLLALRDELRARGHRAALFGTSPDRDVTEDELRVVRRPEWDPARLFRDPAVADAFAAFAERFRPDLIHVHNLHALGLDLLDAIAAVGVPVVQTVHDFSVLCPNSWCVHGDGTPCPGGAGAKCFEHRCETNYPFDARQVLHAHLRLARSREVVDVALSPSNALAERLRANGFGDVRQLFYFVDAEAFAPPEEARDGRSLLFLGRLVPEKGLDVLLEAMPRVLAAEPAARLTVLGDGIARDGLLARSRELGLADAVRFESKVPHAEVERYLATAGALVVPSIWSENSPVSIYESLACGLPIVASDTGGIPDLVRPGETGWLARPRDPASLARALLAALGVDAGERDRLGRNGRALALDLSRERHLGVVEALYEELLARGPRPAAPARIPFDDDLLACLERLAASSLLPAPPLAGRVRRRIRAFLGRGRSS